MEQQNRLKAWDVLGMEDRGKTRESRDSGGASSERRPYEQAANTLSAVKSIRLDGQKILLVDDSLDNRRLFERILNGAGASVDLAENGAIAVLMNRQEFGTYDAVIMDIRMPVLDGYEATRQMRASGYKGPIIALTAHATPGERERCLDAGCSHFYVKPIDRLGLLQAVKAVAVKNMS